MATNVPMLNDRRHLEGLAASATTWPPSAPVMRGARCAGLPFTAAWPTAIAMTDDVAVLLALDATRDAWRRAWASTKPDRELDVSVDDLAGLARSGRIDEDILHRVRSSR